MPTSTCGSTFTSDCPGLTSTTSSPPARTFSTPAIRLQRGTADLASDGGRFTTLEIDGTISARLAQGLDERIWAHMETHRHLRPSEIGDYLDGTTPRHSEPLALTQLIVAYQVARAGIERGNPLAAQSSAGRERRDRERPSVIRA